MIGTLTAVHSDTSALEFRVRFAAQGMRWPLRAGDTVEVWRAHELLGEISAALVIEMLTHYLTGATLTATLQALGFGDGRGVVEMRKPLAALGPVSQDERERNRQARRSRRRISP